VAVTKRVTQFLHFVRLGRPLFLIGGFLFHALGVLMALYTGASVSVPTLLWGQVAITSIQLMTHYSNDYFDLKADQANLTPTQWSGGSRILVDGLLSPHVALATAVFLAVLAGGATLLLGIVLQPGILTLSLLFLALLTAWSYSSPPLRLHSRGVGELTTALLVPGLTPLLGFYLHAGTLPLLPFLAIFPLCCFQFNMLLSINFPDAAGDRAVGKRTLVVRLGAARAARLYVALLITAYAALPLLVWAGLPWPAGIAASLGAPIAAWQVWRMQRKAWAVPELWSSLAFWSVALLMGTAALETVAFFWLWFF
jgi:1,4-dihydroxy-2-naphthoate octaprenyltransferase